MSQITAHDLKDQLIVLACEPEPVIPERQTAGHGYDAGCECDLIGGDPDCKIQPPYETVEAYISRSQAKVAEQAATIERLTRAAIFIAFGKQHTGVIPCPQDYSFYIEPFRKAAQQALVGLDINDEQIDAALSNKRQTD